MKNNRKPKQKYIKDRGRICGLCGCGKYVEAEEVPCIGGWSICLHFDCTNCGEEWYKKKNAAEAGIRGYYASVTGRKISCDQYGHMGIHVSKIT